MVRRSRSIPAVLLTFLALQTPAAVADTLSLGLSSDRDRDATGAAIEYRWTGSLVSKPRLEAGWAMAAQADSNGNAWVGLGVAAAYRLGDSLFVEGSFMPGYYAEGDDPLGGDSQFRTMLGLGVDISGTDAVSLAVSHFSNGGLDDYNPGANTLLLQWTKRF